MPTTFLELEHKDFATAAAIVKASFSESSQDQDHLLTKVLYKYTDLTDYQIYGLFEDETLVGIAILRFIISDDGVLGHVELLAIPQTTDTERYTLDLLKEIDTLGEKTKLGYVTLSVKNSSVTLTNKEPGDIVNLTDILEELSIKSENWVQRHPWISLFLAIVGLLLLGIPTAIIAWAYFSTPEMGKKKETVSSTGTSTLKVVEENIRQIPREIDPPFPHITNTNTPPSDFSEVFKPNPAEEKAHRAAKKLLKLIESNPSLQLKPENLNVTGERRLTYTVSFPVSFQLEKIAVPPSGMSISVLNKKLSAEQKEAYGMTVLFRYFCAAAFNIKIITQYEPINLDNTECSTNFYFGSVLDTIHEEKYIAHVTENQVDQILNTEPNERELANLSHIYQVKYKLKELLSAYHKETEITVVERVCLTIKLGLDFEEEEKTSSDTRINNTRLRYEEKKLQAKQTKENIEQILNLDKDIIEITDQFVHDLPNEDNELHFCFWKIGFAISGNNVKRFHIGHQPSRLI